MSGNAVKSNYTALRLVHYPTYQVVDNILIFVCLGGGVHSASSLIYAEIVDQTQKLASNKNFILYFQTLEMMFMASKQCI